MKDMDGWMWMEGFSMRKIFWDVKGRMEWGVIYRYYVSLYRELCLSTAFIRFKTYKKGWGLRGYHVYPFFNPFAIRVKSFCDPILFLPFSVFSSGLKDIVQNVENNNKKKIHIFVLQELRIKLFIGLNFISHQRCYAPAEQGKWGWWRRSCRWNSV